MFRTKQGFTLVELIVVITILAILALVAFLMMSDATVSARDSNRLASIKNIYDASQLQAVQQRLLPLPDQAITLTVSGTDIGWQGYMSGYVAQAYGYSDSVYDPRDNTPYIYRVNQARNKSQYLAYLENGGEVTQGDILLALGGMDGIERIGGVKESKSFAGLGGFGIDTAQATDFSKRVPYVYGDRLGVVLSNTTNEEANVALGSGGTLDLGGGSIDSNYSVYVNEGLKLASVEGTGAVALKTNGGLDDLIANATIVASGGGINGHTTNDPYLTYVTSLMQFDDATDVISDNSWGGGNFLSGNLEGSSTQNTISNQSRFDINSGDFTIEFFYTPSASDNDGNNHSLVSFTDGSINGISYFIRYNIGNPYSLMMVTYPSVGAPAQIAVYNTTSLVTGQKYHIVMQRASGIYDIYVNGFLNVTARSNIMPYSTSTNHLYIGALQIGPYSEYMNGTMDAFRFTKGIARYSSNFTPPISFTND